MNRVEFTAIGIPMPKWKARAGSFIKKILKKIERDNWSVTVMFCSNEVIREYNKNYRNINKPTDILSFSIGEVSYLPAGESNFWYGDIAISLDTMRANAADFKVSEDEELRRLLVHGILHLDGMNHRTNKKNEPMLVYQEKILSEFGGEKIIHTGRSSNEG